MASIQQKKKKQPRW